MQALKAIFELSPALKAHKGAFIISVFVLATSQLCLATSTVLSVWLAAQLTVSTNHFVEIFGIIIGFSCMYAFTKLIDVWLSHEIAYKILHSLRAQIFSALERVAPFGFAGKHTAELAANTMSDAEQLEWFYAHTAATTICALFVPLILISGLYYIIGSLSLLMLIPLIIGVLVPLALVEKKCALGSARRNLMAQLKSYSLDVLEGQRELRSLDMNQFINQRIRTISEHMQSHQKRIENIKMIESTAGTLLAKITSAAILIILTARVLDGSISSQWLACSIVLAGTCNVPVLALTSMIGRFGDIGACAQRINEVLAVKDKVITHTNNVGNPKIVGSLSAKDIGFRYDDKESFVLKEFDLTIPKGQTLALVGATGAGKSTFAHLALRFLDPTTGSICWCDTDLTTLIPDEYRSSLALIPQSGYIFQSSVRDNLLIAKDDASDDELNQALDAAVALSFINKIGGLNAKIGYGGAGLSGGERQRIAIARAFLRNPELLVLDEPLANLDSETEQQIVLNLQRLRQGKTTLIIAHRLKSIEMAEQIALLQDGSVVQQGSHQELLGNEMYCSLFKGQL